MNKLTDRKAIEFRRKALGIIRALPRRILLGLSGGADSTALIRLLLDGEREIFAVHCNFHLRGEESDRDENFCRKLCRNLGVDLTVLNFDAITVAKERKISIEMACRDLRYEAFNKLIVEKGCDKLAVAHHADDNIETLLLNLMRGCGISGARGMLPDSGMIVRPLIDFSRNDILNYLSAIGQDFVIDSTNSDSTPQRNFIRNEVIPMLETRWPAARKNLLQSIRNFREAEKIYIKNTGTDSHLIFSLENHSEPHEAVLHEWLKDKGLNKRTESEIISAINSEKNGQTWNTSKGKIWKGSRGLCYVPQNYLEVSLPEMSVKELKANEIPPDYITDNLTIYLSGKINAYEWKVCSLSDTMKPLGMKGKQTVGKILKEAGVPSPLRSTVRGLYRKDSGHLIWIPGIKRSEEDLIDRNVADLTVIEVKSPLNYMQYTKKS